MAYCASCGTQMEEQFCPKCGAPAGVVRMAPFTRPASTQPGAAGSVVPRLGVNGASALCYLFGFVTGIVFLALAPYNQDRRVRFHAFQSIFLSVAVALLHVGVTIVALMLGMVNLALGALISSLHAVVSLGFFLVALYTMWKSYQGEKVMLPVIGELAERQAGGKGSDSTTGTMGKAA
jgi:uncharacterized membrane protein